MGNCLLSQTTTNAFNYSNNPFLNDKGQDIILFHFGMFCPSVRHRLVVYTSHGGMASFSAPLQILGLDGCLVHLIKSDSDGTLEFNELNEAINIDNKVH